MVTKPAVQLVLAFDPPPSRLDLPRQVLLLRLGQRLGYKAIAQALGCAPGTARRWVLEAADQLEGAAPAAGRSDANGAA